MTFIWMGTGDFGVAERRGDGVRVRLTALRGVTSLRVLRAPLFLPVLLGDLTLPEEFAHEEYDTPSDGQFSVAHGGADGKPQTLREFQVQTLRLDYDAPWLVEHGLDHTRVVDELRRIGRWRTPFRILMTQKFGLVPEIDCYATIRQIEQTLKPGEADSHYLTIGFKEWRGDVPNFSRDDSPWLPAGRGGVYLPAKVTIDSNDTFLSIAKRFYTNPARDWRVIARYNGLPKFGGRTPIVGAPGRHVGSTIIVPVPPGGAGGELGGSGGL